MSNESLHRKKRILVADDDPAILDSVKMLLEDEGYDVDTTANGETVRKLKTNLPDLLILDI
jgi:CheY-like chemotaxis protein